MEIICEKFKANSGIECTQPDLFILFLISSEQIIEQATVIYWEYLYIKLSKIHTDYTQCFVQNCIVSLN